MLHRNLPGMTGLVCALLFWSCPATAASADDLKTNLAPLTRGLDKIRSDLCLSLKLKCTKTAKTPPKKARVKNPKIAVQRSPSPVPKTAEALPKVPGPPVPRPKPLAVSSVVAKPAEKLVPIPRIKPVLKSSQEPHAKVAVIVPDVDPGPIKQAVEAPDPKTASLAPADMIAADAAADCLASLRSSKVDFDPVVTPAGGEKCQVENPVRMHSVATPLGQVILPESPTFNCHFARQFSLWLSDTGSAVVFAQLNKRLARVATGPGYDCRGRNGDAAAKMSEHATGNAVDITTITTSDGTTIRIADAINPASPSYEVLRGLRTTACGYFSTVLGPGSNAAHASHFHFDMGIHGTSGNYKICE